MRQTACVRQVPSWYDRRRHLGGSPQCPSLDDANSSRFSAARRRGRSRRAQQPAMPVVGFLDLRSPGEAAYGAAAFREGLNEVGYVEGQNVAIEYRWAEGQVGRLPALAVELILRRVAVIFAGSTPSVLATKAATTTIPIAFVAAGDPVQLGVVASFNRPGSNATGVNLFTTALESKKLELLHEVVPKAAMIGVLVDPSYVHAETQIERPAGGGRRAGTADSCREREQRRRHQRGLRDAYPAAHWCASCYLHPDLH
jgi:hypothetical protein